MSHPITTHSEDNEYPEDIPTVEEPLEEEPEESYTEEETKQALENDSTVENYQLTGLY